ncbi:hypothetical protein PR202_ga31302 [Eleusine coracana subsp. coracana]|uniref:Rhodanese domain-containing protein n=1 Tax=Eleusine coracana subsp. coracana TaxID=191504 RepID=A0AAV5DPV9_ELECO|nr:hypothetical protein PR202_ga31302 [Eleusine coracana subsp. coracana]
MRLAVVLAICALSALLPPALCSEPLAATVVAVDVTAARELVRSGGHRYLDVRTEEEIRKGHVEDSVNVPYLFFSSSGKAMRCLASTGCRSGVRSQLACADLMAAGFENVKNMEGGFLSWVENGFAVKKPEVQEEL